MGHRGVVERVSHASHAQRCVQKSFISSSPYVPASLEKLTQLIMVSLSLLPQFTVGRGQDPYSRIALAGLFIVLLIGTTVALTFYRSKLELSPTIKSFYDFFWTSFLKPHEQDEGGGQQSALESFYKTQVSSVATQYVQALIYTKTGVGLRHNTAVVVAWPRRHVGAGGGADNTQGQAAGIWEEQASLGRCQYLLTRCIESETR